MPNVEDSWIGCSYDFDVRAHILAIEHHILAAPSKFIRAGENLVSCGHRFDELHGNAINSPDNLLVESPHLEEVGAILTSHAIAKVPPEARVSRYHELVGLRWQLFALQRIDDVRIVKAEHDGIVNL